MNDQRPVRIANCSGFYGDRAAALAEQVRGGEVDVITGDYLAEVTMLILAKAKQRDPNAGYATTFLRQLEPVITEIAARDIRVVVNAGGLNSAGLADATRALLSKHGLDLAVAHVEGDDLTAVVADLQAAGQEFANLDTGKPLSSWGHEPLAANAYLGGFGIAAALRDGARIVVTGRVADASVVSGAAAWWWGWTTDDHDALAGAVAAGHVIECGAQATGGNFSGFTSIERLTDPGFPIAEIDRDGSSVITKHEGTDGAVTVDTVTAQLMYEVGSPYYANPDVVLHLDSIELERTAPDRITLRAVKGSAPPATTKVSICSIDGWRNSSTWVLTGGDIDAKAALVVSTIRSKLEGVDGIDELRFTRIGVAADDPADQMLGSCLLDIAVRGDEQAAGRAFTSMLVEMALSNYPGIYSLSPPGRGSSRGIYWPGLVDLDVVEQVVVHHDGRCEPIPLPATGAMPRFVDSKPPPVADEPTVRAPLGRVAHARSGDKGGNANVGVWMKGDAGFEWLVSELTVARFRELIPESAGLDVRRYPLPNLRAINFVVIGLLDGGATETLRFDKQAKALGEWLRSRHVDIPTRLLGDV